MTNWITQTGMYAARAENDIEHKGVQRLERIESRARPGLHRQTMTYGEPPEPLFLASPPEWSRPSACIGHSDIFDRAIDKNTTAGDNCKAFRDCKAICAECPVRQQCLDRALEEEAGMGLSFRHGVRGGLAPRERASYALDTALAG